jgi:hypothetical protein
MESPVDYFSGAFFCLLFRLLFSFGWCFHQPIVLTNHRKIYSWFYEGSSPAKGQVSE